MKVRLVTLLKLNRLFYAIIFFISLLSYKSAQAAEFRKIYDPETSCILEMTGRIEAGDADKLLKIFENAGGFAGPVKEYTKGEIVFIGIKGVLKEHGQNPDTDQPRRICLNSEGGKIIEALKMARLISGGLGTVVPENKKCLSACAILFLAGSGTGEEAIRFIDRHIHVSAQLGFHAPSLNFDFEVDDSSLLSTAYASALQSAEQILAHQDILKMHPSLFRYMLSTPPEKFFLIDTPGKAERWDINIYGVKMPQQLTNQHILNACATAEQRERYHEGKPDWNFEYGIDAYTPEINGAFNATQAENGTKVVVGGYLDEAAEDCVLQVYQNKIGSSNIANDIGAISFTHSNNYHSLSPISFYNPSKKLFDHKVKSDSESIDLDIKW